MNENLKSTSIDFAEYLQSIVKLDVLQNITDTLDKELANSQRTMMEIKAMYECFPTGQDQEHVGNHADNHEELTKKLLDAKPPSGLLPDKIETSYELDDLEAILASLKARVEKVKKCYEEIAPQVGNLKSTHNFSDQKQIVDDTDSLCQLNKQMLNIKLSKQDEINKRNIELEEKLTRLCEEVHLFTQMTEANIVVSNSNRSWTPTEESISTSTQYLLAQHSMSQYEPLINKLLAAVNEVSYLLKNQN